MLVLSGSRYIKRSLLIVTLWLRGEFDVRSVTSCTLDNSRPFLRLSLSHLDIPGI